MKTAQDDRTPPLQVGQLLPPLVFPLPVYRLIMAAGANRDFNAIHHNTEYARTTGAPDMYANNFLLQGMWERAVRGAIGLDGRIRSIRGFRMNAFNVAGDTVVVHGRVERVWRDGPRARVEFELWSENAGRISVGPGRIEAEVDANLIAS